jgi:hypothetical protein
MGKYLSLDRNIIFLEIIPITLSIFLWHKLFYKKKIVLCIDNVAVVSILNSKTSKSARVMVLLRFIFYWSLVGYLHFKAVHISSVNNAMPRGQFQRFRELAPPAELKPITMPWEFSRQSSTY